MSSILDAVTKDAARSGSIPSASGGAPAHGPDTPDGGSGPSRFRAAILVVVLGVALGAGAARMFGGGEPEADDMLTDKATHREKSDRGADVAAAPAEPSPKGSKKDEAAHARLVAKRKEAAAAAAPPAAPTAVVTPPAPQPLVIPAPAASAGAAPTEVAEPSAVAEPPVVAPSVAEPSAAVVIAEPVVPPAASPEVEAVNPPAVVPPVTAPPVAVPSPAVVTGTQTPPPAAAPASPPSVIAGVPAPPKAPAAVAPPPVVVVAAPAAPPIVASPSIETGAPPATVDVPDGADDEGLPGEEASEAQPADSVLEKRPDGAPEVSILFVAWSRSPTDRMASMRVGSGSLSVVHEGEYVEGLQVSAIHPEAVEFQWTGQKFRVPVRPF